MPFLEHINNSSKVFVIFGLRPYSVDTKLNRAYINNFITIYSIIYLSVLAYIIPFITKNAFFADHPIQEYFSNIFKIIQYSNVTLCIGMFDIQLFLTIINRHKHVKFLNRLCAADEKFSQYFRGTTNTAAIQSAQLIRNLNWSIVVIITYWFVMCSILLIYIESINVYKIIHRCCIGVLTITMSLICVYICYFVFVLHERLHRLTRMFNDIVFIDIGMMVNRKKCLKIIELFDGYMKVKRKFNDTFGPSMLVNGLFDVIMLTVSVYAIIACKKYQTIGTLLYVILVDILPQLIKNVVLVWSVNLLAKQVKIYLILCMYNVLYLH